MFKEDLSLIPVNAPGLRWVETVLVVGLGSSGRLALPDTIDRSGRRGSSGNPPGSFLWRSLRPRAACSVIVHSIRCCREELILRSFSRATHG